MEFASRLSRALILLSLIMPVPAMAWQSRFDIDDFSLYFPCLEVQRSGLSLGPGGTPLRYELLMAFDGSHFDVTGFFELDDAEDCTAILDLETNTLEEQVRHKDRIFDVVLQHEGNLRFSPLSVTFRERGYTSLWRVSDGINEIFLGGTIHILNQDDFPLPDYYLQALVGSDLLYTEVSLDTEAVASLEGDEDPAHNPDGPLSEVLLPGTLARLNTFLAERNVTIEPIDDLYPFFASRALLELGLFEYGFGPGVDYFFARVAEGIGMPNLGLETTINQVVALEEAYEGATPDELILSALDTSQDPDYHDYLNFIITAWREGNIAYFEAANDQRKLEDPDYYNSVLRDRNLAWLPQIEAMFTTSEVELVLVGVGHLAGDDNVLLLLEEAGYTVERYR